MILFLNNNTFNIFSARFIGHFKQNLTFFTDANQCMEKAWFRPVMAVLPAWLRFAQCLRRYRDTKEAYPHLANAAKYSTVFCVIIFTTLSNYNAGKVTLWETFPTPHTHKVVAEITPWSQVQTRSILFFLSDLPCTPPNVIPVIL